MSIQERAKAAAEKAYVNAEDFLIKTNPLLTEGQKIRGVSTYEFKAVENVFKDYPEEVLILDVPEGSLPNIPDHLRTEEALCMEAVEDAILKYDLAKNEPEQEVTPITPKF